MAITKKKLTAKDIPLPSKGNKEKQEVLQLERETIIEAYKQGSTLTSIANTLTQAYRDQFTEVEIKYPTKGGMKTKKGKPTISPANIKNFLKKIGLLTEGK